MPSTALVSQSMHKVSFGVSRGFVTIREGLVKWKGHLVTQAMFLPCRLGYRDLLASYKNTVISWGPILLQTVCQDPEAPGHFVHISVLPAASDKTTILITVRQGGIWKFAFTAISCTNRYVHFPHRICLHVKHVFCILVLMSHLSLVLLPSHGSVVVLSVITDSTSHCKHLTCHCVWFLVILSCR